MKRSIIIHHNDEQPPIELELGRAASIKSEKEFIYFEKMTDGKWRLTFSESVINDFSKIKNIEIIRED